MQSFSRGCIHQLCLFRVQGTELIPQLQAKDVITSARLISGGERLVNTPSSIAERAVKSSIMYGMP